MGTERKVGPYGTAGSDAEKESGCSPVPEEPLKFRKATCDLTPGNKVTILFSESFPLFSDD